MTESLNIAVEGCCHGELDLIYRTIEDSERRTGRKVDLLLICGDFQCVRNFNDFHNVAVPPKYRELKDFHKYFTGQKVAPVLTVFIGGNHEASNILQSLFYGGWVAPNIYFLGFAGVVNFRGLRISGLSGIFNEKHYRLGHFEKPPYNPETLRSVYHLRELEVFQMAHLNPSNSHIDIFLSHDWPLNIWNHGNKTELLRKKPFFRADIESGKLGSPPLNHLLQLLKPSFWFAAHLHVKFAAVVPHSSGEERVKVGSEEIDLDEKEDKEVIAQKDTKFLALDKALPRRQFLEFIQIPIDQSKSKHINTSKPSSLSEKSTDNKTSDEKSELQFDIEWLTILRKTQHLMHNKRSTVQLPELVNYVTLEEMEETKTLLSQEYGPDFFIPAVPTPQHLGPYCTPIPQQPIRGYKNGRMDPAIQEASKRLGLVELQGHYLANEQTDRLLTALKLPHIWTQSSENSSQLGDFDKEPSVEGNSSGNSMSGVMNNVEQQDVIHHRQQQSWDRGKSYGGGGRGVRKYNMATLHYHPYPHSDPNSNIPPRPNAFYPPPPPYPPPIPPSVAVEEGKDNSLKTSKDDNSIDIDDL